MAILLAEDIVTVLKRKGFALTVTKERIAFTGTPITMRVTKKSIQIKKRTKVYRTKTIIETVHLLHERLRLRPYKQHNIWGRTKQSIKVIDRDGKVLYSVKSFLHAVKSIDGHKSNKPKTLTNAKSITLTLILQGKNDKEIIKAVKTEFPHGRYDQSHISWYRSHFVKDGLISPEFASKRSKLYKLWLQSQKEN